MDILIWLATGLIALLFGGLFWWLAADAAHEKRRARFAAKLAKRYVTTRLMGKHNRPDDDGIVRIPGEVDRLGADAVTVPVLLERAIVAEEPLRLAWSPEDVNQETGLMRPYKVDDAPTGVLPVIRFDNEPYEQ